MLFRSLLDSVINEPTEIEKFAIMLPSALLPTREFDTNRPNYRGSIWSSNPIVDTNLSGARRRPLSKSVSSASGTSIDSVLLSPLAANRAIYRQSLLLRHSIVSDTQMDDNNHKSNSNMKDVRSSSTSASLVMKRGTLFPPKLMESISSDTNKKNATMDTVESNR